MVPVSPICHSIWGSQLENITTWGSACFPVGHMYLLNWLLTSQWNSQAETYTRPPKNQELEHPPPGWTVHWRWCHYPFLTHRVFFWDFCLNGMQLGSPTPDWGTAFLNVEPTAHVGVRTAIFVALTPCSNKTSWLAMILKNNETLLWCQSSLVNLIGPMKNGYILRDHQHFLV